jgi:hypothetical protein
MWLVIALGVLLALGGVIAYMFYVTPAVAIELTA